MKNINEIVSLLEKAARLLNMYNRPEWAEKLEHYARRLPQDTDYVLSQIMSLYGGTGSLNDIVLYDNGKLLFEENNELDSLLTAIHDRCAGKN